MDTRTKITEYDVYKQCHDYMKYKHPDVLFHFDLSGVRLPMGLVAKTNRIQGARGWPDFFIPQAKLFIEIKRPGAKIYKKNGELVSDPHLAEQKEVLRKLREMGYTAVFAAGIDQFIEIVRSALE